MDRALLNTPFAAFLCHTYLIKPYFICYFGCEQDEQLQCIGACRSDYARCRIELSAARLTVLAAAHALDKHGNKKARNQIAAAKVYAPNVVLKVIDAAVQVTYVCRLFISSAFCDFKWLLHVACPAEFKVAQFKIVIMDVKLLKP